MATHELMKSQLGRGKGGGREGGGGGGRKGWEERGVEERRRWATWHFVLICLL